MRTWISFAFEVDGVWAAPRSGHAARVSTFFVFFRIFSELNLTAHRAVATAELQKAAKKTKIQFWLDTDLFCSLRLLLLTFLTCIKRICALSWHRVI
jgi:hypothetical protein